MANLSQTRRRFTMAAALLVAISLLAGIYLAFPLAPSASASYSKLDETRKEFIVKEKKVVPLRGLPEKLEKSQREIDKFYQGRIPARYSTVSEEIGKLASKNGVTLSNVHYETLQTDLPSLEQLLLTANLSGEYAHVIRFINAVERNKLFFLIDGLSLADQKGGVVRLELRLETYLRHSSPDEPAMDTPKENKKTVNHERSGTS